MHGRRFGLYVTKKKPGPRGPRVGTLAAVARSTAKGMDSLASKGHQKNQEDTSEQKTLLGLPRRFFIQRQDRQGSANPVWKGKEMKKHNKTTATKKDSEPPGQALPLSVFARWEEPLRRGRAGST